MPFFVRWPAGIKRPGRSWSGLVGQTDLLATLAEVVGAQLPANAGEDSQSFAKVLADPKAKVKRLPLINHGSRGRFSITEGTWKLILPHRRDQLELYDLANDPGEEKNVIGRHGEIARQLQQKMTAIVVNGRTTKGAKQSNDTGYWQDLQWMSAKQYGGE